MTAGQRAALRIVAVEWTSGQLGEQARAHLAGEMASESIASILLTPALLTDRPDGWIVYTDRRVLILGALHDAEPDATTALVVLGRELGISLRELADAAGVSHTTIHRIATTGGA